MGSGVETSKPYVEEVDLITKGTSQLYIRGSVEVHTHGTVGSAVDFEAVCNDVEWSTLTGHAIACVSRRWESGSKNILLTLQILFFC